MSLDTFNLIMAVVCNVVGLPLFCRVVWTAIADVVADMRQTGGAA